MSLCEKILDARAEIADLIEEAGEMACSLRMAYADTLPKDRLEHLRLARDSAETAMKVVLEIRASIDHLVREAKEAARD